MGDGAAIDPAEVSFVPAGLDRLATLTQLYLQLSRAHREGLSSEAAAKKLRLALEAGQRALLFKARGTIVGCVFWADLGDHLLIRNYVIDEPLRGRGLGVALFNRLRAEVFPPDKPLRLDAAAEHTRRFWAARGFREWSVGMRTDSFGETS